MIAFNSVCLGLFLLGKGLVALISNVCVLIVSSWVLNTIFIMFVFVFCLRVCGRSLKHMNLISLMISSFLYPLCLSLCARCSFILSNVSLLELVRRYRLVSPLIIAFWWLYRVVGVCVYV